MLVRTVKMSRLESIFALGSSMRTAAGEALIHSGEDQCTYPFGVAVSVGAGVAVAEAVGIGEAAGVAVGEAVGIGEAAGVAEGEAMAVGKAAGVVVAEGAI